MCQGRTGKLRGTLSCRLEFDWLELLEIRERKHIIDEGTVVNFSDNHDNYFTYRYIWQDDDLVHYSKNHTNLDTVASPWTKR